MEKEKFHGYCIQCKKRIELIDPQSHKMRNNRTRNHNVEMMKGKCPSCGRIVYLVTGHG